MRGSGNICVAMNGFVWFCLKFYFFGFLLGIRNIISNGLKLGLKKTAGKILQPINHPSRFVEHFMIWRRLSHLCVARSHVLDISSPKLLALFLANSQNALITTTDLLADYLGEWQVLSSLLGDRNSRLAFESTDARLLCHSANCFDAVYSLSVIEHIPNNGDLVALAEFVRVVKPGGLVLLTVPFGPMFQEHYGHQDVYERKYTGTPVFFSRIYDIPRLKDLLRAVDQTAALEEIVAIGEITTYSTAFDRLQENIRGLLGPLSLPVALLNYEIVPINANSPAALPSRFFCLFVSLRKL
jgi:ubiquinone/menaquinone biosynthesis C-methylase UbiE